MPLAPRVVFPLVVAVKSDAPWKSLKDFIEDARKNPKYKSGSDGGGILNAIVGSLYLGGGTPSLLPAGAVAEIVALVDERYGLAPDAEITLEANPGRDDRGDAAALVAAGITRLSYGVQALDDATLKRLGRRHRAADVADAVTEARTAGVSSLSLDLLYDVPGGTVDGWMTTLDWALELEPDHLSLYALTLDDPDAEGLAGSLGDHLPTTTTVEVPRLATHPRCKLEISAIAVAEG